MILVEELELRNAFADISIDRNDNIMTGKNEPSILWYPGRGSIALDGSFTLSQLEALVNYIKAKES